MKEAMIYVFLNQALFSVTCSLSVSPPFLQTTPFLSPSQLNKALLCGRTTFSAAAHPSMTVWAASSSGRRESYTDLAPFSRLPGVAQQDHMLFHF